MRRAETDEYRTMKHFLKEPFSLAGFIVTHTSVMSPKQVLSAETFFLVKMQRIQGLMSSETTEYQGMTVLKIILNV